VAVLSYSFLSDHESSNPDCILEGFLKGESDVFVTLTGGCPFSKSFEVSGSFLHSYLTFEG
jgi:hypothetical protein